MRCACCCDCRFQTEPDGDDECPKLMNGMLMCTLEKKKKVKSSLSVRNTVLRESHTGPYITIGNCAGGKKVSAVCRSIKEDIFFFL